MTDNVSALNARDDLRELAEHFETVSSLDLTPEPGGLRAVAGPRLPPGVQELLDVDEVQRALDDVADWAGFCARVLQDERDIPAPDETPARIRLTAEHVGHFLDHDDEMLAFAFYDDLAMHLRALRQLAHRGERIVHTGRACQDPTCTGRYAAALTGDDPALVCPRCKARVPHSVWSSWPRARVEWITIEHAARLAGTTVGGIKMRASRGNWRRLRLGKESRYHVDDVTGAA